MAVYVNKNGISCQTSKPKHPKPPAHLGAWHVCQLCGQKRPATRHHLTPKSEGGPNCKQNLVWLCGPCHTSLHQRFDTKTLATQFSTIDALRDARKRV